MKQIKLYNVIFPIWHLLFFPLVIFITLMGNFIIDSVVLIACFYVFKLSSKPKSLKGFYKRNILKVWSYGFLADFVGALILLLLTWRNLGLSYELTSAINYNPFSHPLALLIIVFSILVSAVIIFTLNYKITPENP